MPIYVGNSGSTKVLGMTKTSQDQQNIKDDTIFHSSLPYVKVIEHELTSYTFSNQQMWVQDYYTDYWSQSFYGQTLWWCGQVFPLTQQLQNMLQNTSRGFMVFIQWNDGYWEPFLPHGYESDYLRTQHGYASSFTMQQNLQVCNYYRNTYGLSKYSTNLFIPRRKVNGSDRFDSSAYVTKVRILELVGLDVASNGQVTITKQNQQQNQQIKIDNKDFIIGSLNIMQERYLQLLTNVTNISVTTKTHNVQQDMIYPASISYTVATMDLISKNRTSGMQGRLPRNAPPITFSSNTSLQWDVANPITVALIVKSLSSDWTKLAPEALCQLGGVYVPRLGNPTNYDTYIQQSQQVRRDDFISRSVGTEQVSGSQVMQVGVLAGDKFGTGVYMDSRRPQIGRGGRELFSPDTQGVSRVGTTRRFLIPREALITGGGETIMRQFHSTQVLTSFTLSQSEQNQEAFLVTFAQSYNPPRMPTTVEEMVPNTQLTIVPPTSAGSLRRTKRSTQDQEVGYTIQGYQVDDHFSVQSIFDMDSFSGILRPTENTRQVHQISLRSGDKFIISETEVITDQTQSNPAGTQQGGIIHYLHRVGNVISIVSEAYVSKDYQSQSSIVGTSGCFCGGYQIGLTQVL